MKTTFEDSEVLETRRNCYKMSLRTLRKSRKKRNEDELTKDEVRVFNEPLETEADGNNFWTVWLTLLVLLVLLYNYTTRALPLSPSALCTLDVVLWTYRVIVV